MAKKRARNETKKEKTTAQSSSAGKGSTTAGATHPYRYATAIVVVVIAYVIQYYYRSRPSYDYDPNLKEMKYDIGNGEQTFLAYVTPEVSSFYKDAHPLSRELARPEFDGLSIKFINMSNQKLRHYW